jgi:hypothetical protein
MVERLFALQGAVVLEGRPREMPELLLPRFPGTGASISPEVYSPDGMRQAKFSASSVLPAPV